MLLFENGDSRARRRARGWRIGLIVLGLLLCGLATEARAGLISTTGSGGWSSTTPDAPWPGGVLPTAGDDVVISDGHIVTVDADGSCLSLTVGQGTSGLLEFEAATPRTLTVSGDVTIAGGAALRSAASGTVTSHSLTVGGSLTNNGTLDLSTNANTAGADLHFTGSADAALSGGGGTTDLRTLTVDKGSTASSMLTLDPSSLTVRGSTGDLAGFLIPLNGTVRVAGSYSLMNRFFTIAAYTIPATAGFWLDNPNATVTAQNSSVSNDGLLRITQGSYNVGISSGRSLGGAAGAQFVIEGGALSVSGRLTTTQAVSYTQSSGLVTVAASGNGSSNVGSFDLSSTGGSFTMSGGTILLRQASSATTPLDYRVSAGTIDVTGGTVQLGEALTSTRYNYRIAGPLPQLVIDNTINNKSATIYSSTPATEAFVSTILNPGTTLDLNGFNYMQLGASFINNGTLNGTAPGSRLRFQGSSAQTYSGTGKVAAPLDGLVLDNPLGLTIDAGAADTIPVTRAILIRGTLINSQKLKLGTGGVSAPLTQLGAPGLSEPGGSFDAAPTVSPGSGGYSVFYSSESVQRTTGYEIPSSRTVTNLTVGNPNGVALAGGDLTVLDATTFIGGNLVTDDQTLVVGPSGSVSQTSGHVVGQLRKPVGAGSPSLTFEVGSTSDYTPVEVAFAGVTVGGELTASATIGDHPDLANSGIDPAKSVNRYWTLSGPGIAFGSCDAIFHFVPADVDTGADPDSFMVERRDPADWTSLAMGSHTATSTQATGLTSFGDFAIGEPAAHVPQVVVGYPNGGEVVVIGLEVQINWTAEDSVGVSSVDVLLSRSGLAGPYDTLAVGLPNTGTYVWLVDGPTTSDAYIAVVAHDSVGYSGADSSDSSFEIANPPTAVGDLAVTEFRLASVAPNPTRGRALVQYEVPRQARVRLTVLDVQGREMAVLADGLHAAGRHQCAWTGATAGRRTPTGVYFIRMQAAGMSFVRRVVVTR